MIKVGFIGYGSNLFVWNLIFEELLNSSLRHNSNLSQEDMKEMIIRTLFGTSKLFIEKNMDFEKIIQRVATKGGITEEGVKIFKLWLPETFDEMFEVTLAKRETVKKNVESSWSNWQGEN